MNNQSGLRPVAGGTPALPGSQPALGSGYAGLGGGWFSDPEGLAGGDHPNDVYM